MIGTPNMFTHISRHPLWERNWDEQMLSIFVGLARLASFFLLPSQKKETKEKATPSRLFSALLIRKVVACETRPSEPHKSWLTAELGRFAPLYTFLIALLDATKGETDYVATNMNLTGIYANG